MQTASRLGQDIRDARIAAGLTQAELGEFVGDVDRHSIAAIERGQVTKQVARLLGMLDAMGLEIELVPCSVHRARPKS